MSQDLGGGILGKGKNYLYNLYNLLISISRGQIHERFEHSLDSIRAILAELEAFQILTPNGAKYRNKGLAAKYDAISFIILADSESLDFSFKDGSTNANKDLFHSSFHELYKWAVDPLNLTILAEIEAFQNLFNSQSSQNSQS